MTGMKIAVRLRSDDPPQMRAAKIMTVCGMTEGDLKTLDGIMQWMTRCIEQYAEADEEARRR